SRAEHRRFRADLDEARDRLAAAGEAERRRLEAMAPPVAAAVALARSGGPDLWRRVPGDADFPEHLLLRLGTGAVPWAPPVLAPARRSAEVDDAVEVASVLAAAP